MHRPKFGSMQNLQKNMKHRIFLSIIYGFVYLMCYAVPAYRNFCIYKQIDGSIVTLGKVGDEYFHCYVTIEGYPVLLSDNGGFYYGVVTDQELTNSNILVHDNQDRNQKEMSFLESLNKEGLTHLNNIWEECKNNDSFNSNKFRALKKHSDTKKQAYIGSKKGLVILVNFANLSMIGDDIKTCFYNMFNQIGYAEDNHIGSVHDYFYDQSYGKFDLTFDVIGPIQLTQNYGYYGQNRDEYKGDRYAGTMIAEACYAVDDYVNFKDYDWNNDGIVETVFVVYAGYGENASSDASTIWPHKSSLSGRGSVGDGTGAITLDGVMIDVYACSSELAGSVGQNKNGIGTACHEFSHCLGLPDLYDTDYSGAFGMNKWDVMDAGSYSGPNGRGEIPYGYSAFERAFAGWLEFDKLENESCYALQPLNDYGHAYILYNDACENEFFIFENHQPYKWYSYVGNYTNLHGMMITHVDYDDKAWANNAVNGSRTHMRESIVPADNSYGKYNASSKSYYLSETDYQGDLYTGINNINRFSSKSYENCGGKLFNRNLDGSYNLSMTIDNITEDNGVVSFSVGDNLMTPKNVKVSQNADKLKIQWDAVDGADKYIIEVSRVISYLPNIIENEVIEDILVTSYTLDFIACKQCSVRVKAKNEFVTSEWSEFVKSTNDPDGVNDVENDDYIHRVYYNINGTEAIMPKTKGIYIQKENNQTKKIYIR